MDKVKTVLNSVFEGLMKKQKQVDFKKTQQVWEGVVGPRASTHTRIVYLTKEKIRVNVDSSAWLYELNLQKQRIAKELKEALNIEDIKFRLGDIDKPR